MWDLTRNKEPWDDVLPNYIISFTFQFTRLSINFSFTAAIQTAKLENLTNRAYEAFLQNTFYRVFKQKYWNSVCSRMLEDSDMNLHKGGDLHVFKPVSILPIPPSIHRKYVVLSPVPNGMSYNASHLLTVDVSECLELPLNLHLCLHDACLIMKWDKCTFRKTL
jgi:hypothetical protein